MRNTIKNMEMTQNHLANELNAGNYHASKTLVNTYSTLLDSINTALVNRENLYSFEESFREQMMLMISLQCHVERVFGACLDDGRYKDSHTLTSILERLKEAEGRLLFCASAKERDEKRVVYKAKREATIPRNSNTQPTKADTGSKKMEDKMKVFRLDDEQVEAERVKLKAALYTSMATGTLVGLPDQQLRGIGISTMLAEYARDHKDVQVIVAHKEQVKILESYGFRGVRYESELLLPRNKKYLLDDGVSREMAKQLASDGLLLGGFYRI